MSWFRRMELFDSPSASLFLGEAAFCKPRAPFPFSASFLDEQEQLELALDVLGPSSAVDVPIRSFLSLPAPSPVDFFESAADLIQIGSAAAYGASLRRLQQRAEAEVCLRSLCDRVAALEVGFDQALLAAPAPRDRKYKWTTEIKGADGADRKYKWQTEVKAGGERNVRWTAEIGGKGKNGPTSRTYTFQASTAPAAAKKVEAPEKVKKANKGGEAKASSTRVVEITDGSDQGALVLRQAFASRAVSKGKRKELSPQDAALLIQICFREHLVRRSQVLRCLRDLAVAKAKLKEIRALFYNFSYRRRVAKDAEERQRFSEKIIVLLLTVDAIEGPDYMVRAARKSMLDELEAMLDVVDPQPPGKLGYLKRRKFDLPDGGASREMARAVTEVVQLLNDGEDSA